VAAVVALVNLKGDLHQVPADRELLLFVTQIHTVLQVVQQEVLQ
jgi:hypothetical protein